MIRWILIAVVLIALTGRAFAFDPASPIVIDSSGKLTIIPDSINATYIDETTNYTWTGNHSFAGGSLTLPTASSTTEGKISWDTAKDILRVGDGASHSLFIEKPKHSVRDLGVACDGTTDDGDAGTGNFQSALTAASGSTLWLPSGCVVLLSIAGGGQYVIPTNTVIECEDRTAGFKVSGRVCSGGRYPGAACNADAQCLGGGTCPTAPPAFAPTDANSYTLFSTQGGNSAIINCKLDGNGEDNYGRCSGGANDGLPCRQVCSNNSSRGCANDAGCISGGTCSQGAPGLEVDCTGTGGLCSDCTDASGTCVAESGNPSGGKSGDAGDTNDPGTGGKVNFVSGAGDGFVFYNNVVVNRRFSDYVVSATGKFNQFLNNRLMGDTTATTVKGSGNVAIPRASYPISDFILGGDGDIAGFNNISNNSSSGGALKLDGGFGQEINSNWVQLNGTGGVVVQANASASAKVSHNAAFDGVGSSNTFVRTAGLSQSIFIGNSSSGFLNHVIPDLTGATSGSGVQANLEFIGNRFYFGSGTKLYCISSGCEVVGNYFAWQSTPAVISIGYNDGTRCVGTGHAQIKDNLIHTDQSSSVALATVVDCNITGGKLGRCVATGSKYLKACTCGTYPCADNTNCDNTGFNNCELAGSHSQLMFSGNQFLMNTSGSGIDLSGLTGGTASGGSIAGGTGPAYSISGLTVMANQIVAATANSATAIKLPAANQYALQASNISHNDLQCSMGGCTTVSNSWDWRWGIWDQKADADDDAVVFAPLTTDGGPAVGDAVMADSATSNKVKKTAGLNSPFLGISLDGAGAGASSYIATNGVTTCNIEDVAVKRNDRLRVSTTAGKLTLGTPVDANVALALSTHAVGGSPNSVRCQLGALAPIPLAGAVTFDDFITGPSAGGATTGIGALRWQTVIDGTAGCASGGTDTAVAGHPGLYKLNTTTTSARGCVMFAGDATFANSKTMIGLDAADGWMACFNGALGTASTLESFYGGLSNATPLVPADFMGIRFDTNVGDTAFMCESIKASSVCGGGACTSTGLTADTNYHRFCLSHVGNGVGTCTQTNGCLQCQVDNLAPVQVNAVPTALAVQPWFEIMTRTSLARSFTIDYWLFYDATISR